MEWVNRILALIARFEGGHVDPYKATNANTDGAGLSYGLIQWTQRSGSLGKLLARMNATDSDRFRRIFGEHANALLSTTASGSGDPVGGAALWDEAWLARFRAAGDDALFRGVQRQVAMEGDHWKAAKRAAGRLGIKTERGMALLFDTAVNQGPGGLDEAVTKTLTSLSDVTPTEPQKLEVLAAWAVANRRRTSPPTAPHPRSPKQFWKQVEGGEWHVFLGRADLYLAARKRKDTILTTDELTDEVVA